MSVTLKNKTGVDTKVSVPGLFAGTVPANGELVVEDVARKQKVPTAEGEQEISVVTTALAIAKSAVKDYGRSGLEFEHEGKKHSFDKVEDVPGYVPPVVEEAVEAVEKKEEAPVGFGFETKTEAENKEN